MKLTSTLALALVAFSTSLSASAATPSKATSSTAVKAPSASASAPSPTAPSPKQITAKATNGQIKPTTPVKSVPTACSSLYTTYTDTLSKYNTCYASEAVGPVGEVYGGSTSLKDTQNFLDFCKAHGIDSINDACISKLLEEQAIYCAKTHDYSAAKAKYDACAKDCASKASQVTAAQSKYDEAKKALDEALAAKNAAEANACK